MTRNRQQRRHKKATGSHLAGQSERDKATAIYKQQAKQSKGADEVQATTQPVKATRKPRQGTFLSGTQHVWLESLVSTEGEERIIDWLEELPRAKTAAAGPRAWARSALRSIRKTGARHDARGLAVYYELQNNYGKPLDTTDPQIRVVTHEREAEVAPSLAEIRHPDAHEIRHAMIVFMGSTVRMPIDTNGDPSFVAKDLVEAVGARWNGPDAVSHVPEDFKGHARVVTPGGTQSMVVLTEAGMNFYLFRSDKAAALPWQRHLAEVILPSIRKTGRYESPAAAPALPAPAPQIDYQALATIMATTVSQAMIPVLQTVKSGFDEMANRRKPKPENPAQEKIPEPRKRRDDLIRLIKAAAGVTAGMDEKDYHDRVRKTWHRLYDAMIEQSNVDVRLGWASCVARGEDIEKLDWLEKTNNLELAIEIALKLWG